MSADLQYSNKIEWSQQTLPADDRNAETTIMSGDKGHGGDRCGGGVGGGGRVVVRGGGREAAFRNRAGRRHELPNQELSFVCVPIMLARKAAGALGIDLLYKPDRDFERNVKFLGVVA